MTSRLVILISGEGTNLQAIIDAIASGAIAKATILLVVSNRKDAYGLQRYVFVWAFLLSRDLLAICPFIHDTLHPSEKVMGATSAPSSPWMARTECETYSSMHLSWTFFSGKYASWGYAYVCCFFHACCNGTHANSTLLKSFYKMSAESGTCAGLAMLASTPHIWVSCHTARSIQAQTLVSSMGRLPERLTMLIWRRKSSRRAQTWLFVRAGKSIHSLVGWDVFPYRIYYERQCWLR